MLWRKIKLKNSLTLLLFKCQSGGILSHFSSPLWIFREKIFPSPLSFMLPAFKRTPQFYMLPCFVQKKNLTYTCPFLESQSEIKRATLDFRVVQEPPNAIPERWIRNRSMNVSDTVKYIYFFAGRLIFCWYLITTSGLPHLQTFRWNKPRVHK